MKIILNEESGNKQPIKTQTSQCKMHTKIKATDNCSIVSSAERASEIFSLLFLLEHRDHWNRKDNFNVDWTDAQMVKWCITYVNNKLEIIQTDSNKKILSFGSKESCVQFLETFDHLINIAKDLL